ncbi:MAG: hypothetical protein ACREME_08050, partial [Gemmatimonadales bacterium]
VFMSSVLVSAALVPIVAAIFLPQAPKPAAGLASSLAGLLVAGAVFVLTNVYGVFDVEWGTRILTVEVGGAEVAIWQEYAVLVALPASILAFVIGQVFGKAGVRAETRSCR